MKENPEGPGAKTGNPAGIYSFMDIAAKEDEAPGLLGLIEGAFFRRDGQAADAKDHGFDWVHDGLSGLSEGG